MQSCPLIAGMFVCYIAPPASAEALLSCDGVRASVEAEESGAAEHVCDALAAARPVLSECGLVAERGYLVRLVPEIPHASLGCLGQYSCETKVIEVIDPGHFRQVVLPGGPLANLDPDALFASVVVHEWSHAMLEEVTGGRVLDLGDQEYVAYSMQLSALPSGDREAWLRAFPSDQTPKHAEINGLIAAMNPLNFAARAWRYFEANGRCETVVDILAGRLSFRMSRP